MNSENNDEGEDSAEETAKRERQARRARLEPLIIQLVSDPKYKPSKPRVITSLLGLDQNQLVDVRRTIKHLVKRGRLKFGPKHLVLIPKDHPPSSQALQKSPESRQLPDKFELTGIYRRTSHAYGFVTPENYLGKERTHDIFIPPRKERDACDGDTVRIRLQRDRGQQRISGAVVEVLKRKTSRFVGTYRERGNQGLVEVDGEQFPNPILVGDASAKNCRIGDKVVIEMVHFPSPFQAAEAVIVDVLGPRGQSGVDTQTIIVEFGLPLEFSSTVREEALRQANGFDEANLSGRKDFTSRTVITIDPKTARDFDDAISLEKLDNGNWELGVHIADVSHFVPLGTALDDEAFQRGNSVYLPDKVIPMLPEVISNNLASLQPHRIRYTISVLMEITPEGEMHHAEWYRGAIRSAFRFNYEEIDDYLVNDAPWRERLSPAVFQLVRNMHSLAMPMKKRRQLRGAIDLNLPEVSIDLDEDGQVSGAHVEPYTESHQVIEEFMLAANEAVAEKLGVLGLPYLRRIHEPPNEKKLRDLTEFVRHLGISCESLASRFEIRRVVQLANDRPERQAVHFAVLRSMQKAVYSPKEAGHFALASKHYCHFTSPIRRYPDLIIHRMVTDLIDGKHPQTNIEVLEKWGRHCSATEQRAEQAERELIKLKLLNFLVDRIGLTLPGFITGVEAFGVFVQGTELPAEGLIPFESLPPDQYEFDSVTRTLQGRRAGNTFRLGDRLRVAVDRVDPNRRILQFRLVDHLREKRNTTASIPQGQKGKFRNQEKNREPTLKNRKSEVDTRKSDRPSTRKPSNPNSKLSSRKRGSRKKKP